MLTALDTRSVRRLSHGVNERDGSNNPTTAYTRGNDLSGFLERAGGIGGLLARSVGYSAGNFTSHAYYHADGNGLPREDDRFEERFAVIPRYRQNYRKPGTGT